MIVQQLLYIVYTAYDWCAGIPVSTDDKIYVHPILVHSQQSFLQIHLFGSSFRYGFEFRYVIIEAKIYDLQTVSKIVSSENSLIQIYFLRK